MIIGRWDHQALIDYQTQVYRVSIERLKSTANCFFATGIGDESLTLHTQGGSAKLKDLPCAKTLRNFLASIAQSGGKKLRVRPIGLRERNLRISDSLLDPVIQLEGETPVENDAIGEPSQENITRRRPRRRRPGVEYRIGEALEYDLSLIHI